MVFEVFPDSFFFSALFRNIFPVLRRKPDFIPDFPKKLDFSANHPKIVLI